MSWRENYRQGSFRGVPFRTVDREQQGGRRGELHQFPFADKPWFEDLGKEATAFDFECWVAGNDHAEQASRLIAALEAAGPGTLVDPFRGELTVAAIQYSCRESGVEGGVSDFSIRFTETTGEPSLTAGRADTQSGAETAASEAEAQLPADFEKEFSTADFPAFIEDAAVALVEGAALLAQVTAAPMGGAGGVLRAFGAASRLLPAEIQQLVREPLKLASQMLQIYATLMALTPDPRRRAAAARAMASYGATFGPVTGSTPPRLAQARNQAAFVGMVRTLAAASLVRALADMDFVSYEDAAAERASATALLDALALDAADGHHDDRWAMLRSLRVAMVADLTARGANLARTYRYSLRQTEPALVLARRLTDDVAAIETRAEDIVARNRLTHPGFVAGGSTIAVLQELAA